MGQSGEARYSQVQADTPGPSIGSQVTPFLPTLVAIDSQTGGIGGLRVGENLQLPDPSQTPARALLPFPPNCHLPAALFPRAALQLPASPPGLGLFLAVGGAVSTVPDPQALLSSQGVLGFPCLPDRLHKGLCGRQVGRCCRDAPLSRVGQQQSLGPCVPSEKTHS